MVYDKNTGELVDLDYIYNQTGGLLGLFQRKSKKKQSKKELTKDTKKATKTATKKDSNKDSKKETKETNLADVAKAVKKDTTKANLADVAKAVKKDTTKTNLADVAKTVKKDTTKANLADVAKAVQKDTVKGDNLPKKKSLKSVGTTVIAANKMKKKSMSRRMSSGVSSIRNMSAEAARKNPRAAKVAGVIGRSTVKGVAGLVPGGKMALKGGIAATKLASKAAFKKSRKLRDSWFRQHKESGNWKRNRDRAKNEFINLDVNNNGSITLDEYYLGVEGMFHPDDPRSKALKERPDPNLQTHDDPDPEPLDSNGNMSMNGGARVKSKNAIKKRSSCKKSRKYNKK